MKKIIYKLLSIEHEDTKEAKEEAERKLRVIGAIKGITLKEIGKMGGEATLGKV